jgi:tRNA threonylcarbamoyladenosine biosynthesis protein TsaB
MKILALDTSTAQGSVALIEGHTTKFNTSSGEQKKHSEVVHAFIEQGLQHLNWKVSEIDLFATTVGPGSFTGIRVSINSAKSFAFVFNKPVVGVDSLLNLAHLNSGKGTGTDLITCMINAYKNMVYFGQYRCENGKIIVVTQPTVVRVQDLGTVITQPTVVVGDGYMTYEPHFSESIRPFFQRPETLFDYPTAQMTGQLALQIWTHQKATSAFEWNLISPLYLRASEAEENKKGIKYTPL